MCKTLYTRYKDYWILIALIIFMSALTGICNQISVFELLSFVCFQIFCMVIPGIATMILLPIRNLKKLEKILLVYVLGYILTMLVYALTMLVGGRKYLNIVFITLAVLAVGIVLYHLKNAKQKEIVEEKDWKIWAVVVLAVFFVSLVVFSLRWKVPYVEGVNSYSADFLYWVGDIVALKKKVPPIHFRFLTNDYRYHYLGALQQAAISNVINIPALKAAACYSYIESSVFLGLSSCALVNRMIKNNKVKGIVLLLLLFVTGWENISEVTYVWHIYLVPMSYNIAQSFGVITILLLLVQFEKDTFDINNMIVMACCLFCCTGTKGPTGAVIFCGLFIGCLYLFFYKRERKTALMYAIFSIIGFGLVYLYLSSATVRYSSTNYETVVSSGMDYANDTGVALKSFVYSSIEWIIGFIKYFVRINPWTLIPSVGFIIYSIVHKSIKIEHIIFFSMILIGTGLGYSLQYNGQSQMYFALSIFPFAALLTGCCLENIFSHIYSNRVQTLTVGIVCTAMVIFTLYGNYESYFNKYFVVGIKNLCMPDYYSEAEWIGWPISHAKCEAGMWIKENTNEDALLLSDTVKEDGADRIAVLSERYVYNYMNIGIWSNGQTDIYGGDEALFEICNDLGINYIVCTRNDSQNLHIPENMGELKFENEEVAIYKLLDEFSLKSKE